MRIAENNGITYRILLVLIGTIIILLLYPREGKFKYVYQKNKPWQYGYISAPYSFPINKSDIELLTEKDSLLKEFVPYYSIKPEIRQQISKAIETNFDKSWQTILKHHNNLDISTKNVILEEINAIIFSTIDQGIISLDEKNKLTSSGIRKINIIGANFSRTIPIEEVIDSRKAYEIIMNSPEFAKQKYLYDLALSLNLNLFITPNLAYDAEISDKSKTSLLAEQSLTSGMVQMGERIVERGEIIDEGTYNKIDSYRKIYEKQLGSGTKLIGIIMGQTIIVTLLLGLLFLFFFKYRFRTFNSFKNILFIFLNIILFVLLASIAAKISTDIIYIIPFAIIPITIRIFFDSRTAIFVNTTVILISSFFAIHSFNFALIFLIGGMTAAFSLSELTRRSQIVWAALTITMVYFLVYTGLTLIQEGDIKALNPYYFAYLAINGLLILFAYPLIYIEEKMFGYLSDVSLVELTNTNNKLLRMLAEKAPGTFQHCIMVANLAQEAAVKIGANSLLVAAGAYYHDIGKMEQPVFFTENQNPNINPHSKLGELDSAKIVIDHVENGVRLARKYGLPKAIIDFIVTHHGKNKTKFFYLNYKEKNNQQEPENPDLFCYPGPYPFTKETAILMMADSVEAASRSLKIHNETTIGELVDRIIGTQIAEGCFVEAPITFKDIEIVKKSFKEYLKNVFHTRIAYPEEKK